MKRLISLLLVFLLLAGCTGKFSHEQAATVAPAQKGILKVHFIDVGQADAIFVQLPDGKNMLVDAGKNTSATTIINYLKNNQVEKLDFLVGTHPHEDHIGSLDAVIKYFEIGEVLMPKASNNTQTFRDVLAAVQDKGLQVKTAKAGVNLISDGNLSVDMLAPCGTKYESLNNYSAVLKIKYIDVAFLLMGDAEELAEKEILAGAADIKAQVLKVGHHGSYSSTTPDFLQAVSPTYAVISVGKGNDYQHPHQATLKKLQKAGATILRTDQKGSIVFSTDGRELSYVCDR